MASDAHTAVAANSVVSSTIDASDSADQGTRPAFDHTPSPRSASAPINANIPSIDIQMSATFQPKELHDFYQPFSENKEHNQQSDNGSESAAGAATINTDWRSYAAPTGLFDTSTISSEVLLGIITTAIDNIIVRNQEELSREEVAMAVAREQAARDQTFKQPTGDEEPYLPITIDRPENPSPTLDQENIMENPRESIDGFSQLPISLAKRASKKTKKKIFDVKKLFQRSDDGANSVGESSSTGARREAMRTYVEHRLSKINLDSQHQGAQETIAALRKSKTIKVPKAQKLVECVSCLDDIAVKEAVKVTCHSYCKDCFSRLVQAACQNEQQWPPKCCLNEISFRIILKNIPEGLRKTFHNRQSEWNIPISERVYCHMPDCAEWVRPANINLASRVGTCSCKHKTCTICRGAAHTNTDCPQDQDLKLTNELAENEGWKRCGRCQALVEHREACQHMTCRCGYQFCYVCTQRWRTCSCTMQQLADLKQSVNTRRMQRQNREQVEADELETILKQIEAFEMQQSRRAEEERQEQLRLQEERWQQIVKKRIRLESLRRKLLQEKYQDFRQQMDNLHAVQQVLVATQYDADSKQLTSQHEAAMLKLEETQSTERKDLEAVMQTNISNKKAVLQADYSARVKLEREMEQTYKIQLREYWEGKTNAESEILLAMHKLQKRMDQGHQLWQKWKDSEVKAYRHRLEDDTAEKEELMYSITQRLKAQHDRAKAELAQRLVAERRWVSEVIEERGRLVTEAETNETEEDADSLFTPDNEDIIVEVMESIDSEIPGDLAGTELIEQLMENVWTEDQEGQDYQQAAALPRVMSAVTL